MKVISRKLQHRLVVVDVERQKLKKSLKKSEMEGVEAEGKKIKQKFEERVVELLDTDSMDLWGSYKNGVLQASDELCGKTKERGDRKNLWWWNEQLRDAINQKKKAFKLWCINRSAENKNSYRKARNETKKAIAKAMKQEAEEEMSVLFTKPNDVFKFVNFMRKEGKDIEGGGCMKDKDGKLIVSEKDRGKLWKEHMKKIMNVEN